MKNLFVLFIILMGSILPVSASDTDGRVIIGASTLYRNGLEATVGYEIEREHHTAWEVFGNAYLQWKTCLECGHVCQKSFWHNYNSWEIGIAYKPCVMRTRNNYGNLRVGGACGSNTRQVLGGMHLGYEHNYVLGGGPQIYWQVKTEFLIKGNDLFRTGVGIGLKF